MQLSVPLVLASRSPRRKRLLEQLGLSFTIHASPAEEVIPPGMPAEEAVQHLAEEKAQPVAEHYPDALTLAADTVVVHAGTILGKPASPEEARAMLRRLSGTSHTVYTGFALAYPPDDLLIRDVAATTVAFASLSDAEIDAYVATGAPMDKAGAYGIQDDYGAVFVREIVGDYYTVVGLPLHRLYVQLRTHFSGLMVAPAP